MTPRRFLGTILAGAGLAVILTMADTPISIPCPANSPCESIEAVMNDNTHGSVTITMNVPEIETVILNTAQADVNANLPAFLTQQVNVGNIRYVNGRIILHQIALNGAPPLPPHPPHPIPQPHPIEPNPPDCGKPPHPPCPSTNAALTNSRGGPVAVSLIDEYQKEHDHFDPFPLPGGHWINDGWPTVGKFTVYGGITFGLDTSAAMPEQHLLIAFREDNVKGSITLNAIQGPFSFSLGGKTSTFSFSVVDSTTAAQYGLTNLSVSDVIVNSIDASQAVVTAVIGPAPTPPSTHR
jgi:hypothetical protein